MATVAWPALPLLQPNVGRERIDKRDIFESAGGREVIRTIYAAPRYRYTLNYVLRSDVAAPSPWGSYSEMSVVDYLVGRSNLGLDQIQYTDPVDGVTRNVRVDSDSFRIEQQSVSTWWMCEVSLISQV